MDHWVELGRAQTSEGDELILRQRDQEFEIRFNGWQVMSSRSSLSEKALARLVFEDLGRTSPLVLIGGLGMGYSVRATLDAVGPEARVIVSELVLEVVDWNRGPLAGLACRPLDDSRVEVRSGSIVDILSACEQSFDAILLDVDNGPDAILYEPNRFLYLAEGLKLIKDALTLGGVLGVWSADCSLGFENALEMAGMRWRRVIVDACSHGNGREHTIYLARTKHEAG